MNYLIKRINYCFMRKAKNNYICEYCGKEIHKNEYYYYYKPDPHYDKYRKIHIFSKWAHRCIDCKPQTHVEISEIESKKIIGYMGD